MSEVLKTYEALPQNVKKEVDELLDYIKIGSLRYDFLSTEAAKTLSDAMHRDAHEKSKEIIERLFSVAASHKASVDPKNGSGNAAQHAPKNSSYDNRVPGVGGSMPTEPKTASDPIEEPEEVEDDVEKIEETEDVSEYDSFTPLPSISANVAPEEEIIGETEDDIEEFDDDDEDGEEIEEFEEGDEGDLEELEDDIEEF